jgi:ketosteroid isomerase-like protein
METPTSAAASTTALIAQHEQHLRQAMLAGDANQLATLLADDMLFADQQGQLLSKEADLAAHRLGTLHLTQLLPLEQTTRVLNATTAVVAVLADVAGTYAGQPFRARCRYVRVWAERNGQWQVAAGSVSNAGAGADEQPAM